MADKIITNSTLATHSSLINYHFIIDQGMAHHLRNIHERKWIPQASWSLDEVCWCDFLQNGQTFIGRYKCLIAHISTADSQPWNNPQLWCSV
ncbi:hypothetical protein ARMSODRAFT_1014847 [Armillaria solidipes]|uniref:Uncharacterized protein n=1 Tax=Armillaria solidipes TaxID=1076256 RepID=A0A2H3C218_9AGAR|nr:hypothetical protein ARMSODRAFT_1014847 [Armillaria solidipes]